MTLALQQLGQTVVAFPNHSASLWGYDIICRRLMGVLSTTCQVEVFSMRLLGIRLNWYVNREALAGS